MTIVEVVEAMMVRGDHHDFVRWCKWKGYMHGGIHIKTYKGSFLKEWLEEYDLERGLLPFSENMERLQKTIDYYEERVKKLKAELQEKDRLLRELQPQPLTNEPSASNV